jgi:putative DNA methylase
VAGFCAAQWPDFTPPLTYKKKLIEVALPLEAINTASMKEKTNPFLKGHPRALHQWWARRPLPASRAILFAQLVDDPSSHPEFFPSTESVEVERKRLFKIIEDLVQWENSSNIQVINSARREIEKSIGAEKLVLLDPFSGGGAIPFEAQRLGLKAIASDLNPVAALISKGMIEYPALFSGFSPVHPGAKERHTYTQAEGLSEDIRYYGGLLQDIAFQKVGNLFPTINIKAGGSAKVLAWVWARTVPSPDPAFKGAPVPIAASFILSTKKGREAWIEPIIDRASASVSFRVHMTADKVAMKAAASGTKMSRGANFRCLLSDTAITADYVKECGRKGVMGAQLMAIVAEGQRRRLYLSPTEDHENIVERIKKNPLNDISLPNHSQYVGVLGYGMKSFGDLFTARQDACIRAFIESLTEIKSVLASDIAKCDKKQICDAMQDDYSKAIVLYLSFAIDKLADFFNAHCGWNATNENIAHLFGRHAIPMVWDYAEGNPFGPMLGFDGICKSVSLGLTNAGIGPVGAALQTAAQSIALTEDKAVEVVVSTDPPYYDNIPYADIADFFYGFLRHSLRGTHDEFLETLSTPKAEELVADRVRHGSAGNAEAFFLEGMREAMTNLHRISSDRYPITIYYAFKQSEIEAEGIASTGWATFLEAVLSAGMSIVGTWPVRTENSARLRANNSNALASSVVLVCRKRKIQAETITRSEFIRALKRELPPAIAELQAANIAPADMPQSAIGTGMGVYSRYRAVLEADDSAMTVKTALQLINAELDEYLGGIQGEFDADTRFAITWFEHNGMGKGNFGVADSLARARGIAVDSVKHAGIVESAAGKVRLLKRDELDPDWAPEEDAHLTVWECLQHLVRLHERTGLSHDSAALLKRFGPQAEAVKDLAYCLYDIAANKRREASEATVYNALIADWSELSQMAATVSLEGRNRQTRFEL